MRYVHKLTLPDGTELDIIGYRKAEVTEGTSITLRSLGIHNALIEKGLCESIHEAN